MKAVNFLNKYYMADWGACQISSLFYNWKGDKIALQLPDLKNTAESTFSTIYDSFWGLFDILNKV